MGATGKGIGEAAADALSAATRLQQAILVGANALPEGSARGWADEQQRLARLAFAEAVDALVDALAPLVTSVTGKRRG